MSDDASTTLYPVVPSGPVIDNYRPAASPASSSTALAPAPSAPAVPTTETPAAEPRSAAMILYGDSSARSGNELAIASRQPAVPAGAATAAAEAKPPEGQLAVAEPKAEPTIDTTLPQAFLDARFTEPAASSADDYNAVMHPGASFEAGPQFELVKSAFHAAGIGQTAAAYLTNEIKTYAKSGPNPNHTPESATATLEAWFPGKAAEHIANANKMVDRMAAKWPGIRGELNVTNLGNNPRLIRALSAIYTARRR